MHWIVFTGIVEDLGTLEARTPHGPGARLVVSTHLGPLSLGESVAVHGVCLTVARVAAQGFEADCSAETLQRTTLGQVPLGARVHLERALVAAGRLGGHFVAGHIDGIAHLEHREAVGDAVRMAFRTSEPLSRYIAEKGSISLDGVSLTVNQVQATAFEVMLVPYTMAHTAFGQLAPGDTLNLEVDLLARYVARLLETSALAAPSEAQGVRGVTPAIGGPSR